MDSITAVASATRDHNALCSVYVDTTQAGSGTECLNEICHQFVHHHVVGEPDVVGALLNPSHSLHTLVTDAVLKAASTLVSVSSLEDLQCRPWVNFFNSASSSFASSLMGRHAEAAKVGTPTFTVSLTKTSPDSGIKAHVGPDPKTKDLYREFEVIVEGENDLRSQLKRLDLSTLNTLGTGLLMNINGCRTLVTGDNLAEFGNSTDILTQQWQQAVLDRLNAALWEIQIDPATLDKLNRGERWLILTVWFESTPHPKG